MSSRSKIAFIIPTNGIAGGVFVAYLHAEYLQSVGHDVTIIFEKFRQNVGFSNFKEFSVKTISIEDASTLQFDLVMATWWETVFSLHRIKSEKYAYFVQSDERRFYRCTEIWPTWVTLTYALPGIEFITEANWIKTFLHDEFGKLAHYAPNGVDTAKFNPAGPALAPKTSKIRVLVEGPAEVPFKRVEDAFSIVNALKKELDIEVWYVCSSGTPKSSWNFDKIFYSVPFSEMPKIYRSCHLLVKVSAVEGFFGPPLEMMASGGTCLVSNVTGYDEYIEDEVNSLVISIGDVKSGIEKLRRLVLDHSLREKLTKNAANTARNLDWELQHPKFVASVEQILSSPPVSQFERAAMLRLLKSYSNLKTHYTAESRISTSTTIRIVIKIMNFIEKYIPSLAALVSATYRVVKKFIQRPN